MVGLVVPGKGEMGRNQLDGLTDRAKKLGAAGLVWMRVRDGGVLEAPVTKFLSDAERDGLRAALAPSPGDLLLIVADPSLRKAQSLLGTLRLDLGAPERLDEPLNFTWVVEFPLFEGLNADGLSGEEGTFVLCSFWLVSCLAMAGEVDRAEALYDRLTGFANDLGLLAEEIDTVHGEQLGNFPQAFSHIGLIRAAADIDRARGTSPA